MRYKKIDIDTATPHEPESSLLIIYTGGTMGMKRATTGALMPFDFNLILEQVPSLKTFNLMLTVISFEQPVDSSNMNPEHWTCIGQIIYDNYDGYDGFVILHGTDTMAHTASALSFMLSGLSKPVILTGAQLPISVPRTDARENLITALAVASAKENGRPVISEVCIYFNDRLLRGNRARKVQSIHFGAFESDNYPPLAVSGIMIDYNKSAIRRYDPNAILEFKSKFDQSVAILKIFPGLSKESIDAVLDAEGIKGIILETFGSGNAPTEDWFLESLKRAIDRGVIVFNVSQCIGGKVMQGKYESSRKMKEIGVLSGNDITTEAAVAKMMHLLGEYDSLKNVKKRIIKPICGEMT